MPKHLGFHLFGVFIRHKSPLSSGVPRFVLIDDTAEGEYAEAELDSGSLLQGPDEAST